MDKNTGVQEEARVVESLPFVLDYLVEYKGAVGVTTSGTWEDTDGSDYS